MQPILAASFLLFSEVDGLKTEKLRGLSEFFFNAQQLVIFRDAVGARSRAGLDLSHASADSKIGDERVFRLSAAVRNDGGVAVAPRQIDGFQRLADRAYLIYLN